MNTNDTLKYFIYCRKSSESEDRQVASIEDQLNEMKKIADQHNLEIVDIITESKSAKKPGREKFNEMIQRIHQGEANGIICWKINRLARNPVDGGQISWLLQQSILRHIKTSSSSHYPTDNVIMLAVELGMANQYVKDLSDDVKRGMRQKALRGWYPCSLLPAGYIHNPERFSDPTAPEIIVDIERFKIIQKSWELVLSETHSVRRIYKIACDEYGLRNQNGKKYSESTFYGFFRNKFYCGFFDWTDTTGTTVEIKGHHKPMVTEAEFEKVQKMFGDNGRPRQYACDEDFAFRGPLSCGECGCKITAERKLRCTCTNCKRRFSLKNTSECPTCHTRVSEMEEPSVLDKTYYRCTGRREGCGQKNCLNEEKLEEKVQSILSSINIPIEFHEWLKDAFTKMNENETALENQVIKNKEKRKGVLNKQLDNYARMRADNEINSEQFIKYKKEVEQELRSINQKQNLQNIQSEQWFHIAENYSLFATNAPLRFKEGTKQQKKDILTALGSNHKLKNKNLYIALPKALVGIKSCYMDFFKDQRRLEPVESFILKEENTLLQVSSSNLLPIVDKFRTLDWRNIKSNLQFSKILETVC